MTSALIVELLAAGVVLALAVCLGTFVHELSHAAALWLLGVSCTVVLAPDRGEAGPLGGTLGRWATVRPTAGAERLTPWRLRVAALTPLVLLAPFALVAVGAAPDPFSVNSPLAVAAAIGWAACALPSPQDFALVWYPGEALDEYGGTARSAGTDA